MPSSVSGQDNQILRCDWLSCPLGTARRVLQEKFPRKSYDKSFIDQVCSVKMAGYWPRSFLRVSGPRLRLAPKTRKKRARPTSGHLDLKIGQ